MAKEITKMQDAELDSFLEEIGKNQEVILILNALKKYGKIKDQNYTVLKAGRTKGIDNNVTMAVLGFENGTVKVIVMKTDFVVNVSASIIETVNGKEVMKGFKVVKNRVELALTVDYDENFKKGLRETESKVIPELTRDSAIKVDLPCIYGNWCGPGCSGPDAPISSVDSCCKSHDNCYGSEGYFACSCDNKLLACLAPYVAAGSEWAIVIYAWFSEQPCNPFA